MGVVFCLYRGEVVCKRCKGKMIREKRKRKQDAKKINMKKRIFAPVIPGARKIQGKVVSLGLYLTKIEKNFLYKKYEREGLVEEEARKRIKEICKKMGYLVASLRKKKVQEEEINKRFKEEFAKICEK